jgi:hypothetical protein
VAVAAGTADLDYAEGAVYTDTIAEVTAATGVTIDGLRIKDGYITPAAGGTSVLDLSGIATGEGDVIVKDNLASAFEIREGSSVYVRVVTTDSGEAVQVTGLRCLSTTAAAITTTRTLTSADSGGCFSIAKTGAYAITLPTPAQGMRFKFLVLDTGANIVTISDGAAHLYGAVSVANVSTAMTGTTISLASGNSVGDWIEFEGVDSTHYLVTGACIAAADITVA